MHSFLTDHNSSLAWTPKFLLVDGLGTALSLLGLPSGISTLNLSFRSTSIHWAYCSCTLLGPVTQDQLGVSAREGLTSGGHQIPDTHTGKSM